jgi:hypothetical protein
MPVASAATSLEIPVGMWNWYWEKQTSGQNAPNGSGMPGLSPTASGIKAGNLPVAFLPTKDAPQGALEKVTFLYFDTTAIPAGSIVDSFVFTLVQDPAERQQNPVVPGAGAAAIDQYAVLQACKPLGAFAGSPSGQGGEPFEGKPELECTDAPSGQYDATAKSFTFDLTLVAQDWVAGNQLNFGVGIRNAPDFAHQFQYSFLPAATIKAKVSYSPAPPVVTTPDYTPPQPSTGGYVPLPDTGGYVPQPQPAPQPAPRPVVPIVNAPRPVAPAAAVPFVQDSTPTRSFWAAAIAAVLLLGVASLVLGDAVVAPAMARRETKLDRVLRSRAAAAAAPPVPGTRPRVV